MVHIKKVLKKKIKKKQPLASGREQGAVNTKPQRLWGLLRVGSQDGQTPGLGPRNG